MAADGELDILTVGLAIRMNSVRTLLYFVSAALVFGQTSELFEKAPPSVDEALRARVGLFYDAHISGKFRLAFKVVADDSQDEFLAASKDVYKSCEVSKINYEKDFTRAKVTTACKGELHWHGRVIPATMPLLTTWKVVDGLWYWYHTREDAVVTPFGLLQVTPDKENPNGARTLPADPMAAARMILSQVAIDKTELQLKGDVASRGEVTITNKMPGAVSISVDRLPYPGMKYSIDQTELPSGASAKVVFSYDPNDPSIQCGSCTTKAALPAIDANVRISPTAQVFPVKISFAVPAAVEKSLPKLPVPPAPKD